MPAAFVGNNLGQNFAYFHSAPVDRFKRCCSSKSPTNIWNKPSANMSSSLRSAPISNSGSISRRRALQLTAIAISTVLFRTEPGFADTEFSTYKGPISLGFSFSYPAGWKVKKKPIKTHLSEVIVTSDKESTTSAGLVVDAVKIDNIDTFGAPEVVGQKVVDMEMKKESVSDAVLIQAKSINREGLTYYTIDYSVDSSRGAKRYQAKATITGNQLYVFTTQASKDSFEGDTKDIFSTMLDSFIVSKQYL